MSKNKLPSWIGEVAERSEAGVVDKENQIIYVQHAIGQNG